ncbi:MAG: M61 family metallopeptidase [Acidobacteria bacterium]|nr:M61 family metallopeptidase [Acidobacteriota bacterium]
MRYFSYLFFLFYIVFFSATSSFSQTKAVSINYNVKLESIEQQLFHVRTEIKNLSQDKVTVSLPVWTPGWYTIENYGKNILKFKIVNSKGDPVTYQRTLKQTWEVATKGQETIVIDFDYRATILALNQAKISQDFAFFTGTQLFLQVGGYRNNPVTVQFDTPNNWNIISALKETSDPKVFTATDYDTLVDSPTQMGKFDLTRFEVDGKPHYFIATPAGVFSQEKTEIFVNMLKKMALAHKEFFKDLPYEKYLYFYFFTRAESNAGGALEHNNSFVAFAPNGSSASPDALIGTASHEFFHIWNVKRIRPVEMWPYDYSRENESPLLWVSEGFTSYFGPLALYRSGIYDQKTFLNILSNLVTNIENNEAHSYISPAESSASTWLGYDTSVAFEISYYTTGANLGSLLDLAILHDTNGEIGLDEVMRTLYKEHYNKNKGFSTNDLLEIINKITKHDYKEFFQKYVWGTEGFPYEKFYSYAGFSIKRNQTNTPVLGIVPFINDKGEISISEVLLNSPAAKAGLQRGDVLLLVDDLEPQRRLGQVFEYLATKLDQNVKIRFRRGGEEKNTNLKVGSQEVTRYEINEIQQPSPEQLKIRAAWLQTIPKANKQSGN